MDRGFDPSCMSRTRTCCTTPLSTYLSLLPFPFPWYSVRGSGMVPIHPSWAAMSLCPCSSLVSGMDGWSKVGPIPPPLPPLDRWESVGGRGQVGFRPRRLGVRTGTPSPFEPEGSAGSKGSCAGVGCPFRTKGPGRGSRRRNRWMRCCEAR
eukprot:scaffold2311_cov313-Pavlova_lutheri.AAC.9